ncbi:RagB/SusD family nutrient uptake outer membrane protein [Spirosoma sp. BT702]|uniref:RagB/SusD family nutrient uptake outer membrane protein n=1 Tax=Spirosoma profusum TaxID=2771354 RepID=A0A926Y075_9BACT|nr:RagB/SusD family nutrient uptake outer membrane protein [Spirosoma profusum]MBD2703525.1 RagB/SusD family nutrient uptake outer membrane protein [Spirosoma profusum]
MKSLAIKLVYAFVTVMIVSSCTDDLTLKPISQISNASFWQSKEDAQGALNGMYVRMRSQAATNLFVWGEGRSEIYVQNFGFDPSINFYVFTNNLSTVNAGPDWTTMYSVVQDANLIIKNVPTITFPTEAEKNSILAQAYAMRAFIYFTMTKTWGDLILIDQPTETVDPAIIYRERSPQADVFKFIKQDIEKALSLFPVATFPAGRTLWSKPAVNALKSDVFLWTAKRLNGGSADFTTALAAITELEATSGLELLADYTKIFDFNNKGNNEIIMAVRFQVGESSARSVYGGVPELTAPKAPFTDQAVINKLLPLGGKDAYWQISKAVADQFSKDDLRKAATLIEVTQTKDGVTSLLYVLDQKWPGVINGGVRTMYDDYILYRYGDIVLMKAEILNGLGRDPSVEINKIRKRAYGATYAAHTFVNGTQASNDEAILQERLFELLQEGKRWWDLVRFGKALEKVPLLKGKTESALLFPIQNTILSLEPKVKQNPGY